MILCGDTMAETGERAGAVAGASRPWVGNGWRSEKGEAF